MLRNLRLILCFLFIIFSGNVLSAQKTIEFTPLATEAYNAALSLKLNEAQRLIQVMKTEEPDNYASYFIENYIDFFRLFIGENITDFNALKNNKSKRIKLLEQTPKDSPYFLYCKAEINLQWALIRLKFEEYSKAFFEVRAAYNDLQSNVQKFPNFIANKKSLGVLHATIGTIPDEYKWGVSWIGGMNGSIEQGTKELEDVIKYAQKKPFLFRDEAVVMYAFTMLHLNNNPERAWQIVSSNQLKPESNPLTCFVLSNLAMRTGRNEVAINYLTNRPKGPEYYPFLYLDFMLGTAKLHRLDSDADIYLKKYVNEFKGKNYIKEAWQKLAWHALITNNPAGYTLYMRKVLSTGNDQLDEDKNAEREAKSNRVPNALLLKSRLLFDGGYLARAYKILNTVNESYFKSEEHRLEYHYRKGRIAHSLKMDLEAVGHYLTTIKQGQSLPFYYACNAALNLGLIYEKQQDKAKASHYFNLCLKMSPNEYKVSLHQKAKAGLNRL